MAESDISLHEYVRTSAKNDGAVTHAWRLIFQVCRLSGTAAFIDEAGLGPEGKELRKAIRTRNTPALSMAAESSPRTPSMFSCTFIELLVHSE